MSPEHISQRRLLAGADVQRPRYEWQQCPRNCRSLPSKPPVCEVPQLHSWFGELSCRQQCCGDGTKIPSKCCTSRIAFRTVLLRSTRESVHPQPVLSVTTRYTGKNLKPDHFGGRMTVLARQSLDGACLSPAWRGACRTKRRQATSQEERKPPDAGHAGRILMRAHVGFNPGHAFRRASDGESYG